MDYKQLLKDIFTLNISAFSNRFYKLMALVKRKLFFKYNRLIDSKKIPIIINNRNRYTYLLQLISWLEKNGYTNIYIIDNDSTYPQLLDYYSKTIYKVFFLKKNVGHLALWKSDIINQFKHSYYVYTDPDVLPVKDCPPDFMALFIQLLNKYPQVEKIGFGLKTDDLPNLYADKQNVIEWEGKFWKKEIEKDVFDAGVDTTFALYRPYTNGEKWVQKALRTGGKYMLHHLPWYENSASPSEEELYYKKNVRTGASHWIPANK